MIRSIHRIVVCTLVVLGRGSVYASGPSDGITEADFDSRRLAGQQAPDNNSLPAHMQHKANLHAQAAPKLVESGYIGKSIGLLKQNNKCHDDAQSTPSGYRCLKMDLDAFVSIAELGSRAATEYFPFGQPLDWINDIWGYISPKTKKRYAITGHWDGTSFVELTVPNQPAVLGFMETSGNLTQGDGRGIWRDIKVVNDFAYVGAEVLDHGVQVFDVKLLDSLPRPSRGSIAATRGDVPRLSPVAVIGDQAIGSSHNIVSFEEEGKILVVGMRQENPGAYCSIRAGETVVVLDVSSDPLNPPYECLELGSLLNKGDIPAAVNTYPGYVHDADCFVYKGPDEKYYDLPLCIFFAESEIGIFDMRNKAMISTFTYDGVAYAHQGGVSSDFSTLYSNDELDEICDSGLQFPYCANNTNEFAYPNTRIFGITSLENVGVAREFVNTNAFPSADHNLYVKGDHIFSAAYQAGARVYEIQSDKSLEEAAFFEMAQDCSDLLNCPNPFNGAWTHYPYPDKKSTTIATSIYLGLFAFFTRLDEPKKQMIVGTCQYITKRKKCEKMDACDWDMSAETCDDVSESIGDDIDLGTACESITKRKKCERKDGCDWVMSKETCGDVSESLGEGVALGTAGTLKEAVTMEPRSAGYHAKAALTLAWAVALACIL